ncbi:MAG: histidinol-phosphate transaminase [Candidatus Acidiferrum sp.]|jgi:histidinol-phosphate aminotransferase
MKATLPVRQAILDRRTYEAPAEGRLGKIRLDFNENTAGCSPAVLRALAKITPEQFAMYPEYQALTKRLAKYFRVRPQELMLTNGGDDALRVFFDSFVEPASHIVICEPTFPMYRYWAEIAGAQIDVLRYTGEMQFPFDAALQALRKKPRVMFVCNPNNPTGTLLQPSDIEKLLNAATHTAIVVDEAYVEFSGATVTPWINRYPNLFSARTFSKAAGLAALRLGAVIANENSLRILRRAMPPFPINIAALVAAEAAVRDHVTIEKYVANVKRLRAWFASELTARGIRTYPSAGNFLLANFGPEGPALFKKLERQSILVRARTQDMGPGFVRITIGSEKEMRQLLKAIAKG